MLLLRAFLLLTLVACTCLAVQPSIFSGTWSDPYHGGIMNLCTAGNIIYGTYSNIGYIQGNVTIDSFGNAIAAGQWVEAGATDKASGTFQFTLLNGDNKFTGVKKTAYYRCAPAFWNSDRLVNVTTLRDCMPLYLQVIDLFSFDDIYNYTLEGVWSDGQGGSLAICFRDDTMQATFSGNGRLSGYSSGRSHFEGLLARASFRQLNAADYTIVQLFVLGDPNPLRQSNNGSRLYVYTSSTPTSAAWNHSAPFAQFSVIEYTRTSIPDQPPTGTCQGYETFTLDPRVRWNGAWTDWDFGFGRLYLCTSGNNRINGVFSELGYMTGFVRPTGTSIYGRFYDAGDSKQVSGDFDLAFDRDTDHFDGWWRFDNSAYKYRWNASRISVLRPTDDQCLKSSTHVLPSNLNTFNNPNTIGSSLAGVWRYDAYSNRDTLDLCIVSDDLTRFVASYNFNGNQGAGFMQGQLREDGRVAQGLWFENGKAGIMLMVLTASNNIQYLRWNHQDIQTASFFQCDGDVGNTVWVRHRNVGFGQRVNTQLKNSSCYRNAGLSIYEPAGPFTPGGWVDPLQLEYEPLKQPKRPQVVIKRGIEADGVSAASSVHLAVVLIGMLVMLLL